MAMSGDPFVSGLALDPVRELRLDGIASFSVLVMQSSYGEEDDENDEPIERTEENQDPSTFVFWQLPGRMGDRAELSQLADWQLMEFGRYYSPLVQDGVEFAEEFLFAGGRPASRTEWLELPAWVRQEPVAIADLAANQGETILPDFVRLHTMARRWRVTYRNNRLVLQPSEDHAG